MRDPMRPMNITGDRKRREAFWCGAVIFYNEDCRFCKDTADLVAKYTDIYVASNQDKEVAEDEVGKEFLPKIQKDVHLIEFFFGSPLVYYSGGGVIAYAISRIKYLGFVKDIYDNLLPARAFFDLLYKLTKKIKVYYNNL